MNPLSSIMGTKNAGTRAEAALASLTMLPINRPKELEINCAQRATSHKRSCIEVPGRMERP